MYLCVYGREGGLGEIESLSMFKQLNFPTVVALDLLTVT